MENTTAISILFVETHAECQREGCKNKAIVMDALTGKRFCQDHAPRLWLEKAYRNDRRIEEERLSLPRPCVVW